MELKPAYYINIMTSLYFITLNNQILNTRFKSRTCIVGLSDKLIAKKIKRKLNNPNIEISDIDYMKDDFYEMLKLNQVTLMIAGDIKFSEDSFEFEGDIIDSPDVTNDELVQHFEKLYVQDCPK
jgi:hypothetical protein